MIALSECLRNHEDVRKQNRGIERETLQWLQGDFRGDRRRADHLKKRRLGFERTILRQIAASLTHHPEGRAIEFFAGTGGEEAFAGSHETKGRTSSIKH